MRPRAHLPVLRARTSTRVTATVARLPISKVPRRPRILRKGMVALSRARLGRYLLTSIIGEETTGEDPRRTSTRLATQPRKPRFPATTKVTRRILRATRTTAGTRASVQFSVRIRELSLSTDIVYLIYFQTFSKVFIRDNTNRSILEFCNYRNVLEFRNFST